MLKIHVFILPMLLDLAELRQRTEHAVAGIDHQMLVRLWQELDYKIDVWPSQQQWACETPVKYVGTETLGDTLSCGRNLSAMSAMVTDLQTHETPEGLLTCPVYSAHFPTFPSLHLRYNSFSNPSVALSMYSPTLPLLRLHHSSFSNPSSASHKAQARHIRHLASRPLFKVHFSMQYFSRAQNMYRYMKAESSD